MTYHSSSLGETDSKSSLACIMKKATVEGSGEKRTVIIDLATLHEKDNKSLKNFVTLTFPMVVHDDSLTDNQLINIIIKNFGKSWF